MLSKVKPAVKRILLIIISVIVIAGIFFAFNEIKNINEQNKYSVEVTDSITGEKFLRIIKLSDSQKEKLNQLNNMKNKDWQSLSENEKNYLVELKIASYPDSEYHQYTSRQDIESLISTMCKFYEYQFLNYPEMTYEQLMQMPVSN